MGILTNDEMVMANGCWNCLHGISDGKCEYPLPEWLVDAMYDVMHEHGEEYQHEHSANKGFHCQCWDKKGE